MNNIKLLTQYTEVIDKLHKKKDELAFIVNKKMVRLYDGEPRFQIYLSGSDSPAMKTLYNFKRLFDEVNNEINTSHDHDSIELLLGKLIKAGSELIPIMDDEFVKADNNDELLLVMEDCIRYINKNFEEQNK